MGGYEVLVSQCNWCLPGKLGVWIRFMINMINF